ncbi:uncharacterized protein LOC114228248 [Eptesicus fuscus]|uniref:uncharacterized protein LOC114228248 n=1 Tax=Eptesicus fuscus TaxID=29078 RepID=UPI002404882C|nr:uncharacterized protein LOC114228248 [Eptesicus fuscus]
MAPSIRDGTGRLQQVQQDSSVKKQRIFSNHQRLVLMTVTSAPPWTACVSVASTTMDYMFIWTQILFIYCCFLTVHCAQPNCTSVTDFDDCPGNISDFCPKNIVCACKDGEPFCKCPNFRGQWGNYWYMGAKCDQLWSTLDLILVATLPGIGLALIVGVTIQTVHYCKKKSKKNINDDREQRNSSGFQPQHNYAYAFDTAMKCSQPNQGQVNTKTHLSGTALHTKKGLDDIIDHKYQKQQ